MNFCSKEDLFEACKASAINAWAKDDPKDSEEVINHRIESAIQRASDEVSLFIGKVCSLPLDTVPTYLKDIAVKLSLYQLLSRRGLAEGSADNVIKANRNSALRKLELIAAGKLQIIKEPDLDNKPSSVISYFPPSPYYRS